MEAKAIELLLETSKRAEARLVSFQGKMFSTTALHDPAKAITAEPEPTPLTLHTLAGLVDFAKTEPRDYYRIHVGTHAIVSLLGPIVGYHQQRATYATAEFADLFGKGFQFGVYLDLETMNVAIQTLFIQTPERDAVLKVIGNVRDELVQTSGDDGVTQTVTAKAGVAIVQELKVPNPVTLQPYRTFREVGQPASPFVLRMRRGQGPVGPTAALFESDGGAWRLEAIANIHNWLKDKLPTIPIIA